MINDSVAKDNHCTKLIQILLLYHFEKSKYETSKKVKPSHKK